MNKTILLTGATGYLGGYLSKHFLLKGYRIIALALNHNEKYLYSNYENVKLYYLSDTKIAEIFDKEHIDIIIHTATLYGRYNEDSILLEKTNVEFPLIVLQEAVNHNAKIFINTGTILNKNISAYAMTKNHFEDWLSIYSDKIKCVNLKLDHFYGPNDKPIKFIARVIQQLKNNVDHIDLTEGYQTRDFIYIDDIVSAFDIVIENEENFSTGRINTFEVGTDVKTSIKDLVMIIKKELKNETTKLNFGKIPLRQNEMLDYEIDTKPLRLLGWKPQYTSIEEGIKKIITIEQNT